MNEHLQGLCGHVRQKDGLPRVTGAARYYADYRFPDMLHARMLRSPYPQADIVELDADIVRGWTQPEPNRFPASIWS